MGSHINDKGQFQSDKYPTCPPDKVPLSVNDPAAQPLLWEYAERRAAGTHGSKEADPGFAADLQARLRAVGFESDGTCVELDCYTRYLEAFTRATCGQAAFLPDRDGRATEAAVSLLRSIALGALHGSRRNEPWPFSRFLDEAFGDVYLGHYDGCVLRQVDGGPQFCAQTVGLPQEMEAAGHSAAHALGSLVGQLVAELNAIAKLRPQDPPDTLPPPAPSRTCADDGAAE